MIKHFFLFFFCIVLVSFYSLSYHTDKLLPYFLDSIIHELNSSLPYSSNLDMNHNIEGDLSSSIKIKKLSIASNNSNMNINAYEFEPYMISIFYLLEGYFFNNSDSYYNMFYNSDHTLHQISIEDKEKDSFLVIPKLEINRGFFSIDTLFGNYYNQYTFFAYNLNGEISDSKKNNPYYMLFELALDSIEVFLDHNDIKIEGISYTKIDSTILIDKTSASLSLKNSPISENIILSNTLINVNIYDQMVGFEIQDGNISGSYFENLEIRNLDFQINQKDNIVDTKIGSIKLYYTAEDSMLLEELSLKSKIEKNKKNYSISLEGLNNIKYYDNNLKYNFIYKMNYSFYDFLNSKQLEIIFFDGYDEKGKNLLNVKGTIDFEETDLSLNINTRDLSYFGILPKTSEIDVISYNFKDNIIVDYKMYKVGGLVKKKFTKMSGQSTIKFKSFFDDYLITSTPIFITDKSYNGSINIPDISDVNEYKISVNSSFVNILKKNKLETVK